MFKKIRFNRIDNIPLFLKQKEEEFGIKLDFDLIDTQTVCIKNDDNVPKLVPDTRIFNKDSNFIADVVIKQFHTIDIYEDTQTEKEFYFELQEAPECDLNAILICSASLVFHHTLKNDIFHLLYKTMLLNGYLIKIRQYKNLILQVNEFIKQVIDDTYPKKVLLNVATGVAPTLKKEDSLNFYFDKEDFALSNIQRTITTKNFLMTFKKEDLLFEYIKPIASKAGRDLKGETIISDEKIATCPIKIKNGMHKEDEVSIKFFAAQDGFLKEVAPYTYAISHNLILSDSFDSIKEVQADKMVKINSVVDSKSTIYADICFIATHQGNVKAHTVVIDSLEKGKVEARFAFINASVGGVIKADYVYIKELRSSNQVYTRYSLVIDNIVGDFNILEVDPENFVFLHRDRLSYIRLVDEMRKKMRFFRKKMTDLRNYLFTSQSKAYAAKNQDPNKLAPKKSSLDTLKQREKTLEEYKEALKEYSSLANLWYIGEKKLKDINEAAFHAKVIIRGSSQGQETLLKFRAYEHEVERSFNNIVPQVNNAFTFKFVKEGEIGRLRQIDVVETEDTEWIDKFNPYYSANNKDEKDKETNPKECESKEGDS